MTNKEYTKRAMEWSHRDLRDESDENFGYISGENEPDEAEKAVFELYRDLRDRKGVLDGIDIDVLNDMLHTHIGIVKNIIGSDNQ